MWIFTNNAIQFYFLFQITKKNKTKTLTTPWGPWTFWTFVCFAMVGNPTFPSFCLNSLSSYIFDPGRPLIYSLQVNEIVMMLACFTFPLSPPL